LGNVAQHLSGAIGMLLALVAMRHAPFGGFVRVRARAPEVRPAVAIPSPHRCNVERPYFVDMLVEEPLPTVMNADDIEIGVRGAMDHRADGRIEPRRVSSTGQNPDSFALSHGRFLPVPGNEITSKTDGERRRTCAVAASRGGASRRGPTEGG